jgi:hypothetical protein
MKVIRPPEAQTYLDAIYPYLQHDAPFYARGVIDQNPGQSTVFANIALAL